MGDLHLTTVLLADDHKIVRQGIRALLECEPDLKIVGETGDGGEAILLLADLRPDVLLTDFSMPRYTGIQLAAEIKRRGWSTKIVILSMHNDPAYVAAAFKHGASAYVLKESGVEK